MKREHSLHDHSWSINNYDMIKLKGQLENTYGLGMSLQT